MNQQICLLSCDQILAVDPSNLKALEKVESSIFTVCLDDTSPITRNEVGRALWHGDGRNRFFDKSVQFIVFANGKAGMNGEVLFFLFIFYFLKLEKKKHSMMDATPTSRCSEFVVESLLKNTINHGSPTASLHGLPEPELVNFKLNKDIEKSLEKAATRFDADVARHDHHVLHYNKAGKNQIKKYKMSPDAFAQVLVIRVYIFCPNFWYFLAFADGHPAWLLPLQGQVPRHLRVGPGEKVHCRSYRSRALLLCRFGRVGLVDARSQGLCPGKGRQATQGRQ